MNFKKGDRFTDRKETLTITEINEEKIVLENKNGKQFEYSPNGLKGMVDMRMFKTL